MLCHRCLVVEEMCCSTKVHATQLAVYLTLEVTIRGEADQVMQNGHRQPNCNKTVH